MSIYGPHTPSKPVWQNQNVNIDLTAYAKKTYVDKQDMGLVARTGDSLSGDLNLRENLIRVLPKTYPPAHNGDEAVSWDQLLNLISSIDVKLDGCDVMTGDLSMGNHRITNVYNPVASQDVATRAYVDSNMCLRLVLVYLGT